MKYCTLASGSKGNATWIEIEEFALLVDNGLSAKELLNRIETAGLNYKKLKYILITHEHSDHIRGVGPLARKLGLQIFSNKSTFKSAGKYLGKVDINFFETGSKINLNNLEIETMPISHDTEDPVAYKFNKSNKSIAIATDLGVVTNLLRLKLKNLNALILEANHDFKMLMDGPYPWFLKQRIRDRKGHLANEDAMDFVKDLYCENLKHLVLAHLSETNNSPQLVEDMALKALEKENINISIAMPNSPSEVFKI